MLRRKRITHSDSIGLVFLLLSNCVSFSLACLLVLASESSCEWWCYIKMLVRCFVDRRYNIKQLFFHRIRLFLLVVLLFYAVNAYTNNNKWFIRSVPVLSLSLTLCCVAFISIQHLVLHVCCVWWEYVCIIIWTCASGFAFGCRNTASISHECAGDEPTNETWYHDMRKYAIRLITHIFRFKDVVTVFQFCCVCVCIRCAFTTHPPARTNSKTFDSCSFSFSLCIDSRCFACSVDWFRSISCEF